MKPTYYRGHWNGRRNTNYRVLLAIVAAVPEDNFKEFAEANAGKKMYPWSEAFKGQNIQMVEVTIDGEEPFYISNMDGSGVYKVTEGLGLPGAPHFTVRPEKVISEIPKDLWVKRNMEITQAVQKRVAEYWHLQDPFGYASHREDIQKVLQELQSQRHNSSKQH